MAFEKITEKSSLYNDLDKMSIGELLHSMNQEDQKVPLAVEKALPAIEKLVSEIVPRMKKGGRILYMGEGTSGRLGVLDASEIPPTFGMPNTLVIGLIAGIFVGCWAMALAEILNVFPIFVRRTKIVKAVPYLVLSIAIGKGIGSLIYFVMGW